MPPVRVESADDGAEVRAHLLRHETAILCSLLNIEWPPRSWQGCLVEQLERPDLPPVPTLSDDQLAWPFGSGVRALRDGEEFECSRGDLPSWCPERWAGGPHDRLLLTESNELVAVGQQ